MEAKPRRTLWHWGTEQYLILESFDIAKTLCCPMRPTAAFVHFRAPHMVHQSHASHMRACAGPYGLVDLGAALEEGKRADLQAAGLLLMEL